jgi:phosphoglucomutase
LAIHPLAGKPATQDLLIDIGSLVKAYETNKPDLNNPLQLVSFGTSGHRGSSADGSFTEAHILAITQAICEYRKSHEIKGPLFMGKDTHALSAPAERTALEVLAANGVETFIQEDDGFTPTPVISHAILCYNRGRSSGLADGIVITPSHNPPRDGGFKYNPANGGPADTDVTQWIQDRANALLHENNASVKRLPFGSAIKASSTHLRDFALDYISDLKNVVNLAKVRGAGLKLGVDPLGGSSVHYWDRIAEHYGVDITVVNPKVDPTFGFMTVDHDGKIRMDCSSVYAMAKLVELKNAYSVAFGNDPDADRHGIVAPSVGLLNPNHYLAVAIRYLFMHRPQWPKDAAIGKTLVSSSIIDRIAQSLERTLVEVPVGFKYFVEGLFSSKYGFGGEESAGASFLRTDGSVWVTDKDGLIMNLLAAEMTAETGKDPGEHYNEIAAMCGISHYLRLDQPIAPEKKARFKNLTPETVSAATLAGEVITAKYTRAAGNNAPIGGLKVVTENGWFAARPSGTESICKIYAESFKSEEHLQLIIEEAGQIVNSALSR